MAASVDRVLESLESRQKSVVSKGERSVPANSRLDQRPALSVVVGESSLQLN